MSYLGGDLETSTNHARNAIYILATGASITDSWRLEVKYSIEYIPTTAYKAWVDCTGPRAILAD